MPPTTRDDREDIDILNKIATECGFIVSEKQRSDGRIELDITRNPDQYEYTAIFGQGGRDHNNFWAFNLGRDHVGGNDILVMEKLINMIRAR